MVVRATHEIRRYDTRNFSNTFYTRTVQYGVSATLSLFPPSMSFNSTFTGDDTAAQLYSTLSFNYIQLMQPQPGNLPTPQERGSMYQRCPLFPLHCGGSSRKRTHFWLAESLILMVSFLKDTPVLLRRRVCWHEYVAGTLPDVANYAPTTRLPLCLWRHVPLLLSVISFAYSLNAVTDNTCVQLISSSTRPSSKGTFTSSTTYTLRRSVWLRNMPIRSKS